LVSFNQGFYLAKNKAMKIHHVSEKPSILNKFLAEIRDKDIQKDSLRFRTNIERMGEIISYELSKTLHYKDDSITTPLGIKEMKTLNDKVVLASILRAGLPLHMGVLRIFDNAENAFISAYRKHTHGSDKFEIQIDYIASPSIEGKVLVLVDPMLATGKSLVGVYKKIIELGKPTSIHVISLIGSKEGINYLAEHMPEDSHLWIADFDSHLNEKGYIIPGLGDAGDLAYGKKL
jgi:uracil phosphoribosyltransferase